MLKVNMDNKIELHDLPWDKPFTYKGQPWKVIRYVRDESGVKIKNIECVNLLNTELFIYLDRKDKVAPLNNVEHLIINLNKFKDLKPDDAFLIKNKYNGDYEIKRFIYIKIKKAPNGDNCIKLEDNGMCATKISEDTEVIRVDLDLKLSP